MLAPTLPTLSELQPHLDKLNAHPGSIVLIAIETLETQNYPRIGVAWLSAAERKDLRAGLTKARKRRQLAISTQPLPNESKP